MPATTPADFLADSEVRFDDGAEIGRVELSPRWAVWGPNGGYLAAIALRAAMARSRLPRPASFHCHFLAIGEFAPAALHVSTQGGGKRAESLRVEIVQEGRTLLSASVWMVDEGLGGYTHDFGRAPAVPPPGDLRSYHDLVDNYDEWYPIWRSMEGRPTRWQEGHPEPGEPVSRTWLRFTGTPIPDARADALRQLFWLDYPGWNATIAAHRWPFPYLTPNLDLNVQFHRFAPEADWMLADGNVWVAEDGLVGCVSRLWSEDGRLLASATSNHSCRPNPQYEQDLAEARAQEAQER